MADRYTYIPYIGLFIIIAWGLPKLLAKLPHQKIILAISMLTALTALGISAQKQTMYWNNSFTLFSHALEVTNNNYLAHNCLGRELRKQDKLALAVEHFNKALQIKPNYANAMISLGCVSTDRGDFIQAIDYFQKALHLKPDSAEAHTNLGIALQKYGRFNDAIIHIRRSLQIEPDNPVTINNLAWLFATCPDPNFRNPAQAISLAQQACRATAYVNPELLDTLAAAFASAGRFDEAVITAQKALNLANENNKQIFGAIKSHLDLYKASKPLIEKPQMSITPAF
jgi:Flp pilus assembly protein TadD